MEFATASARLLLSNCTNSTLEAQERATNIRDLWHPYVLLYTGHCIWAAICVVLSLYASRCLIVIMAVSSISFLVSAIGGLPMWQYHPFTFLWLGGFIKWLIVNIFATIPVLALRACKLPSLWVKIVGIFVYVILGANILWTLGMDSKKHVIVYLNRIAGVMLVISLILHCAAVCREGLGLFEVRKHFPYGFGTSLPWLVCYTVWNALFVAKISIGMLLQDILFWCFMAAYKHWDDYHLPIELYFGFARPVQLGAYIAFSEFMGTFVPYFRDAATLKQHQPLPVNSNAFFLFIAFMNLLWSFVVTFWEAQNLVCGLGFFLDRFEKAHAIVSDPEDDISEHSEEGEYSDYAEDDESGRRCCVLL